MSNYPRFVQIFYSKLSINIFDCKTFANPVILDITAHQFFEQVRGINVFLKFIIYYYSKVFEMCNILLKLHADFWDWILCKGKKRKSQLVVNANVRIYLANAK